MLLLRALVREALVSGELQPPPPLPPPQCNSLCSRLYIRDQTFTSIPQILKSLGPFWPYTIKFSYFTSKSLSVQLPAPKLQRVQLLRQFSTWKCPSIRISNLTPMRCWNRSFGIRGVLDTPLCNSSFSWLHNEECRVYTRLQRVKLSRQICFGTIRREQIPSIID